jgi:hypothetical protein
MLKHNGRWEARNFPTARDNTLCRGKGIAMVAVKEITWEEASAPDFGTPARTAWREAVAEVAAKAHEKLPECNGRVDSAVKIVLAGDVELLGDGTARVASQSNGETVYHVVNGSCDCKDFARAPHAFCKHRLASAIVRRAQDLVAGKMADTQRAPAPVPVLASAQPPAPTAPLPEAPVSITLKGMIHGQEVMVTLRGVDFTSVKAHVEAASQWLDAKSSQPADDTPQCPTHGVPMKLNHKEGRSWWSHKTADGWCKGK